MHWIASRAHVDVLAIFEKYVDPQTLNLLITGSKDAFGRTPFDLGCTKDNPIIIKKFINIIRAARPLDGANMEKSSPRLQTLMRTCYAEASRRRNSLLYRFLAEKIDESVNLTELKVHQSTLGSLQNKSASEVLGRSRKRIGGSGNDTRWIQTMILLIEVEIKSACTIWLWNTIYLRPNFRRVL